jgi:hypothetical protein
VTQYVNTEALAAWYQSVSSRPWDEDRVLNEVLHQFIQTRKTEFILAAGQSKTGREETYSFQMEHLNCCGADRMIFSF